MNPYRQKPDRSFWRRAIAGVAAIDVDPVSAPPFRLGKTDRVATIGSCFAQHIADGLKRAGYGHFVTESGPSTPGSVDENFGIYTARFGNIYTARQLAQLFDRAYGVFFPSIRWWRRPDATVVDPFRPQIQRAGFASVEALLADQEAHFKAVRLMFESCNVLIVTLGLTESWACVSDGAVVPLAPGVVDVDSDAYQFQNLDLAETTRDLDTFIGKLRMVNPHVHVILTVSPVPLIATYEDRHVLVSNTYSKAALRVAVENVVRKHPEVAYFPSYEIVTGAHTRGAYFGDDLRSVTDAGVAKVMELFFRHYTSESAPQAEVTKPRVQPSAEAVAAEARLMRELQRQVCDEEAIDPE